MEDNSGAPATGAQPLAAARTVSGQLLAAAVGYVEERHWDVFPGAWLEAVDGVARCSCGAADCPAPGAHPVRPDWPGLATGSAAAVRRMWSGAPASVLLPTGRSFDAIDVPESAGLLALARMERLELPLGPVLCVPAGRLVFLVLPGARAKVPDALRRLGHRPGALDLVVRGDGDWVTAPPTRTGSGLSVVWAREPTPVNRWLPDAESLLSPLAYACGQEAAARLDN